MGNNGHRFCTTREGPPARVARRGESGLTNLRDLQCRELKRPPDFGEGRKCAKPNCPTILRISNPGPYCSPCQEKEDMSRF